MLSVVFYLFYGDLFQDELQSEIVGLQKHLRQLDTDLHRSRQRELGTLCEFRHLKHSLHARSEAVEVTLLLFANHVFAFVSPK